MKRLKLARSKVAEVTLNSHEVSRALAVAALEKHGWNEADRYTVSIGLVDKTATVALHRK